jgi:glutathione peroxidase
MPKPLFFVGGAAAVVAAVASMALTAIAGGVSDSAAPDSPPAPAHATSVYDFTVHDIDGNVVKLSHYKGDVLLIVNTASLCGNTPQYASLEKLYETYKDQGLRILAFPENDFMSQEPGSNGQIKTFCTGKYNTTFSLFEKIDVKGPNQAPLYKFLTSADTDPKFAGDIEWNFAKFIVARDGKIVGRVKAGTNPLTPEVVQQIEAALKS